MKGTSTHLVLSVGYGSGGDSGGGYNRGRNDYPASDDRGSSGYSRGRGDHRDNNDDNGGGGSSYNRGRSDYHNNNGGGGGGGGYGGDDNRMETQRDTIFIQNLPRNVTPDELKDVFSQIGMIKVRYYSFNSLHRF